MKAVGRDIVVIGASAGGVEALSAFVRELPPDFPAATFVVLHIPASPPSLLPNILNRKGPLRAVKATDGAPIQPGRIYVAPSDYHLTLEHGFMRVLHTAKENGHRPAVDPLFRTAARAYGARVIGIVLTGALDCGAYGLMAIKAAGGVAVVQDPQEAFCPDMPKNAIRSGAVDHISPLSKMTALVVDLVHQPIERKQIPKMPIDFEIKKSEKRADIVCPECSGAMTESQLKGAVRFRCHVGHSFSLEGMVSEQAHALETALWAAVRGPSKKARASRVE